MFRCQLCSRVVPAGVRQHKLTLLTRPKEYPAREPEYVPRPRFRGRRRPRREPRDSGGVGYEIVQEAAVCPECAAEHAKTE